MSNGNDGGKAKQLFMPEGVEIVHTDGMGVYVNKKPLSANYPGNLNRRVINLGFYGYSNDHRTFTKIEDGEFEVTLRVGFDKGEVTEDSSLVLYDDDGEELGSYPVSNGELRIYNEPWHGFDGYGEIRVSNFPDPNIGWA